MTDEERFFYNHGYKQAERDFIAELEKIKAEIKELAFLFDDLSPDKELVVDLDNIEEVFNKHISELKGENNANSNL